MIILIVWLWLMFGLALLLWTGILDYLDRVVIPFRFAAPMVCLLSLCWPLVLLGYLLCIWMLSRKGIL